MTRHKITAALLASATLLSAPTLAVAQGTLPPPSTPEPPPPPHQVPTDPLPPEYCFVVMGRLFCMRAPDE